MPKFCKNLLRHYDADKKPKLKDIIKGYLIYSNKKIFSRRNFYSKILILINQN